MLGKAVQMTTDTSADYIRKVIKAAPFADNLAYQKCARQLIEALAAERDALKASQYVPGVWRCAKCEFELIQSNLNAQDGSITANDKPGASCPNCDNPLWRVSWQEYANKAWAIVETVHDEIQALKAEVKPCPFCGGEAEAIEGMRKSGYDRVSCDVCGAEIEGWNSIGEAITAWNTRAEPTVKPLVWEKACGIYTSGKRWEGDKAAYQIIWDLRDEGRSTYSLYIFGERIGCYPTLTEPQNIANKDNERRILSALTTKEGE